MLNRLTKNRLKKPTFKYMLRDIKIISQVELTNDQIVQISDIVRTWLQQYPPYYLDVIPKDIVEMLGDPVCFCEFHVKRRYFFIKIFKA